MQSRFFDTIVSGTLNVSGQINASGNRVITVIDTGIFATSSSTGQLTGQFYPLNSNPLGYVINTQTGNFVTVANSGQLTGQFYPLTNNPSGFITNSGFALSSQTGNFITTSQTGIFVATSQTGSFVTTAQTGVFVTSAGSGQLTGTFYPLNNNPLVYKRASDYNAPNTIMENFYWNSKHKQDYEDSQSFVEDWSTSGALWAKNPAIVISGGNVYGGDAGDSNSALARSFVVRTGENARMIAYINVPANIAGRSQTLQTVGFSSDLPGTTSAGGNNSVGIGITFNRITTGYAGAKWNGGSNDTGNLATGTTYILQATIDNSYFTFMLMDTGHNYEYQTRVPRSQIGQVNNVYIWNGDTSRLSGVSVGKIGARITSETIYPRSGIEGVQDFIVNTTDDFGQNTRIEIPKNYDSRVPFPLIIYCHGTDAGAEQVIHTYQYEPAYLQAFKDSGFIVAASANHGTADMGSNNSITDTYNLLNWVRRRYSISSVFLLGVSAGGMVALNALASNKFKCDGFIGLFPVCNLLEQTYATGSQFDEGPFTSGAYGITGGLADFLVKTSGHDPINSMSPEKLFGIPMRIYHSPNDPVVLKSRNSDLLAQRISGYQSEFTIISTTGTHGDSSNYQTGDAIAFMRRCSHLPSASLSGFGWNSYVSPNGYVFHSETGVLSNAFYAANNPSGYITGVTTGNFITTSQTGIFVTTGQTGIFLTSNSSPTFTQLLGTQVNLNTATQIFWTSGTHFYQYPITTNTTFTFTGCQNTMGIEVLIYNTGQFTVAWPSGTTGVPPGTIGVKWQGGFQPVQTTGGVLTGKADLFSFMQLNNTIYGGVQQNYF